MTQTRIVVADDQDELRQVIRITLESLTAEIYEASDGREALELVRSENPDVVILDWMMPGMTGIEVAQTIREESASNRKRVIMLTSRDRTEDFDQGRAAGVFAYLVKPFSPLELIETVNRALRWSPSISLVEDPARVQTIRRNGAARQKVLLVDDCNTSLMLQKIMLGAKDFVFLTASDGDEAIELAAKERPDLIVLDVLMPRVDGFEACRELRSRESTKTIPVLMATSRGGLPDVAVGFESGCDDYITKPLDRTSFRRKVRSLLS